MSRLTHRRHFLKQSTLAGAGLWVAASGVLAKGASPNDKLNLGIIGVGGRGAANLDGLKSENIVALCDVNSDALAAQLKNHPEAKTYADWRKMLDQKDLDAVVISTPDHHHALAAVNAMKRGLHVYCEKPLAHSVHEARAMQETYNNSQGGHADGHADPRHATTTAAWSSWSSPARSARCARPTCGAAARATSTAAGRKGTEPVPANLDWDLWLGPAPERPFNSALHQGRLHGLGAVLGFRQRLPRRHGQPPDRPAVLGPEAAASDVGRGRGLGRFARRRIPSG